MTFKLALIKTAQVFISLVFTAIFVTFLGFFAKSLYKLFMIGFNAI